MTSPLTDSGSDQMTKYSYVRERRMNFIDQLLRGIYHITANYGEKKIEFTGSLLPEWQECARRNNKYKAKKYHVATSFPAILSRHLLQVRIEEYNRFKQLNCIFVVDQDTFQWVPVRVTNIRKLEAVA